MTTAYDPHDATRAFYSLPRLPSAPQLSIHPSPPTALGTHHHVPNSDAARQYNRSVEENDNSEELRGVTPHLALPRRTAVRKSDETHLRRGMRTTVVRNSREGADRNSYTTYDSDQAERQNANTHPQSSQRTQAHNSENPHHDFANSHHVPRERHELAGPRPQHPQRTESFRQDASGYLIEPSGRDATSAGGSVWAGIARWAGKFKAAGAQQNGTLKTQPAPPATKGAVIPTRSDSLASVRTFGTPLDQILARESDLLLTVSSRPSSPQLPTRSSTTTSTSPTSLSRNIHHLLTHASHLHIPLVVFTCTSHIELNSLSIQGLYRVPGSVRRVTSYANEIDAGSFTYEFPPEETAHTVASLLKKFLSSLPGSIWSSSEVQNAIRASFAQDRSPVALAHAFRTKLPSAHHALLRHLCRHLRTVSKHAAVNCMTAENLGIVLFPGMGAIIEVAVEQWAEVFGETRSSSGDAAVAAE